eukprot:Skav224795  [mRNA]  locus=scaffold764:479597:485530:- [translate_table: standard]
MLAAWVSSWKTYHRNNNGCYDNAYAGDIWRWFLAVVPRRTAALGRASARVSGYAADDSKTTTESATPSSGPPVSLTPGTPMTAATASSAPAPNFHTSELALRPVAGCPAVARAAAIVAAHPLLGALYELHQVSDILRRCTCFWSHIEGTVKELARSKDHAQSLLRYASKSQRTLRSTLDGVLRILGLAAGPLRAILRGGGGAGGRRTGSFQRGGNALRCAWQHGEMKWLESGSVKICSFMSHVTPTHKFLEPTGRGRLDPPVWLTFYRNWTPLINWSEPGD